MKTVIYLDVLLLVSFTTSALFLLAAGLLGGVCAVKPWRLVAGALVGAAADFILLAPTLPAPLGLAYQLATGAAAVAAAYGVPGGRCFLRLWGWFWALHLALTGAVLLPSTRAQSNNFSTYLPLSPGLLLACTGGVYLAVQAALRVLGRREGRTFAVTLRLGGTALPLRAFCDTGFSVQEPLSGQAVVLVRFAAARTRLPPGLQTYLTAYFSGSAVPPPPELSLRFVPCTTVAGHCILPAVPASLEAAAPPHARSVSSTRPCYAAFADLPPPPQGWEMLVGEEVAKDYH